MLYYKLKYLLISFYLILFNNIIKCQDHIDVYFSSFIPYFYGDFKEASNLLVIPNKIDPLTLELSVYNGSSNKYISNTYYPGFDFGIKYLRQIKSRIHLTGGIDLKALYNDFLEFQDPYEFKSKIYSRILTKNDINTLFTIDTPYIMENSSIINSHKFVNIYLNLPIGINYKLTKKFEFSGEVGLGITLLQKQQSSITRTRGFDIFSTNKIESSTGIFQDTTTLSLKHYNFNLNLGAKYFINKKIAITFSLISEFKDIFYNAFGSLNSNNQTNSKNIPSKYFGISIGSTYRFSDILKD